MAVKIGSARIDENGKAHGGKAGDQTGKEVSVQNWYLHSKGWRVFRCKDPAKAEAMAAGMQAACDNPNIGYDQWQRHTLYKAAKAVGWAIGKTKVETDCSALIRVLLALVGIDVPEDFRTGNMPGYLSKTGQFVELTGDKYQRQSAYLRRGDILVTKTSGHTVMVLSDGSKAKASAKQTEPASAAKQDAGETRDPAQAEGAGREEKNVPPVAASAPAKAGKQVRVTGGLVNVRSAPGTSARILGVVAKGALLEYQGQGQAVNGVTWHLVIYNKQNAWISGKYAEVVE